MNRELTFNIGGQLVSFKTTKRRAVVFKRGGSPELQDRERRFLVKAGVLDKTPDDIARLEKAEAKRQRKAKRNLADPEFTLSVCNV